MQNHIAPWPLMTAVESNAVLEKDYAKRHKLRWFEFSPAAVCPVVQNEDDSNWRSIKSKHFGVAVNKDGEPKKADSVTYADLGTLCGVWGSAACITPADIYSLEVPSFASFIKPAACLYMRIRGKESMANPFPVSSWCEDEVDRKITLKDAGFSFNIPIPPLLEPKRKIEIIIVLDASESETEIGEQLILSSKWAKANERDFPSIELIRRKLHRVSLTSGIPETILFDPDEDDYSGPAILYIPGYSLKETWKMETLNFHYSDEAQKGMYNRMKKLWDDAKVKLDSLLAKKKKN